MNTKERRPGTVGLERNQERVGHVGVRLDEGVDFNAFYARDSGLNFFHGLVDNVAPPVTVFSGASPQVVDHELGHAILDAVKPELFNTASLEVAAFHEAFGDISSMLSALQLPSLRDLVLQQTGGQLNSNSRLSQLARQLGGNHVRGTLVRDFVKLDQVLDKGAGIFLGARDLCRPAG